MAYGASVITHTRLGRNTVNAIRMAEILRVFARHGFADVLRRLGFHESLPARMLRGLNLLEEPAGPPETFGERLRLALQELGPTFIKFGQVLSTRPDLVGHGIAGELGQLQDRVPPLPFEHIRPMVEAAAGAPLASAYKTFEEQAVAAASLSQVHRAVTSDGKVVAVKVQRPDAVRTIQSDLLLLQSVAEWLAERMDTRALDPVGIVNEFARSIRREMDFTIEARAARQFGENFRHDDRVIIPDVVEELSNDRVLVLEWIDGVRIDAVEEYESRNSDPAVVAKLGAETLCVMVFEHHLFHADPHPGNILLARDNRIAILDLGMAGYLDAQDAERLADLFWAIFTNDARACMEAILALSTGADPGNPEALAHELAEFIAFEAKTIVSGGQVARGMERALEIIRRHGLELAPRFSLLLKALATIEVVGRTLDPQLDMLPILRPHIERLITRRFSPAGMARQGREQARLWWRFSRQVPEDLAEVLRQLRRGRVKIQVHHEHLEALGRTIERASRRNAIAMITAALIVGSSLVITTDSALVRVGILGYLVAGVLGLYLVLTMLWGGER
ncbi:MAG TPA: AarF/UbiB family protein [Candidatus Hydrogenedentes bacterium]|nr:AarF/UbiB family protein [Candidatus Hydrogenedentota bacterium]HPU96695.1 AarF/UbiB family protein [Candidatus Hydrogenedentota bacterium]